jgi:hypothetical protein
MVVVRRYGHSRQRRHCVAGTVRLLPHTTIEEVIDGEEKEAGGERRRTSEIESSEGEVPRQSES